MGKVIVIVVERHGNVAGRTVVAASHDGVATLTAVTNPGGQVVFDDLAEGPWDVTVDGGPAERLNVVAGRANPLQYRL